MQSSNPILHDQQSLDVAENIKLALASCDDTISFVEKLMPFWGVILEQESNNSELDRLKAIISQAALYNQDESPEFRRAQKDLYTIILYAAARLLQQSYGNDQDILKRLYDITNDLTFLNKLAALRKLTSIERIHEAINKQASSMSEAKSNVPSQLSKKLQAALNIMEKQHGLLANIRFILQPAEKKKKFRAKLKKERKNFLNDTEMLKQIIPQLLGWYPENQDEIDTDIAKTFNADVLEKYKKLLFKDLILICNFIAENSTNIDFYKLSSKEQKLFKNCYFYLENDRIPDAQNNSQNSSNHSSYSSSSKQEKTVKAPHPIEGTLVYHSDLHPDPDAAEAIITDKMVDEEYFKVSKGLANKGFLRNEKELKDTIRKGLKEKSKLPPQLHTGSTNRLGLETNYRIPSAKKLRNRLEISFLGEHGADESKFDETKFDESDQLNYKIVKSKKMKLRNALKQQSDTSVEDKSQSSSSAMETDDQSSPIESLSDHFSLTPRLNSNSSNERSSSSNTANTEAKSNSNLFNELISIIAKAKQTDVYRQNKLFINAQLYIPIINDKAQTVTPNIKFSDQYNGIQVGLTPLMFAAIFCENATIIQALLNFCNADKEIRVTDKKHKYFNLTAAEIALREHNEIAYNIICAQSNLVRKTKEDAGMNGFDSLQSGMQAMQTDQEQKPAPNSSNSNSSNSNSSNSSHSSNKSSVDSNAKFGIKRTREEINLDKDDKPKVAAGKTIDLTDDEVEQQPSAKKQKNVDGKAEKEKSAEFDESKLLDPASFLDLKLVKIDKSNVIRIKNPKSKTKGKSRLTLASDEEMSDVELESEQSPSSITQSKEERQPETPEDRNAMLQSMKPASLIKHLLETKSNSMSHSSNNSSFKIKPEQKANAPEDIIKISKEQILSLTPEDQMSLCMVLASFWNDVNEDILGDKINLGSVMHNPVIHTETGLTYDLDTIKECFKVNPKHPRCPVTNAPILDPSALVPAVSINRLEQLAGYHPKPIPAAKKPFPKDFTLPLIVDYECYKLFKQILNFQVLQDFNERIANLSQVSVKELFENKKVKNKAVIKTIFELINSQCDSEKLRKMAAFANSPEDLDQALQDMKLISLKKRKNPKSQNAAQPSLGLLNSSSGFNLQTNGLFAPGAKERKPTPSQLSTPAANPRNIPIAMEEDSILKLNPMQMNGGLDDKQPLPQLPVGQAVPFMPNLGPSNQNNINIWGSVSTINNGIMQHAPMLPAQSQSSLSGISLPYQPAYDPMLGALPQNGFNGLSRSPQMNGQSNPGSSLGALPFFSLDPNGLNGANKSDLGDGNPWDLNFKR